ncbi:hypothetical protein ACI65C_013384 [Semiaphis heraclei]
MEWLTDKKVVDQLKHASILSKLEKYNNEKKNAKKSNHGRDVSLASMFQPKLQLSPSKSLSKCHIINLVFDYIVKEMRPIITCEKPAFRQLIMGLTGISDISFLPDSKVISKELKLSSKISHFVTDNASNFGKAFRTFSIQPQSNSSNSNNLTNNWFCSDNDESSNEENNFEVDETCENIDITELSTIFSNPDVIYSSDNEDEICLPDHLTCSAHTLSLIATTDVNKIEDHSYKQISKPVFEKLYSFWNLVSRSSVASDNIFDICNCKFPVPIITRWNSLFFAVKKVLIHKDKLLNVFEELKLKKLKKSELKFLEEYCLVMEPLALALDKLQGEQSCFLGFVAPTIIALRLKLIQLTHLIYCKKLAHLLIVSLEKRFIYLFDLEHPKSKDENLDFHQSSQI